MNDQEIIGFIRDYTKQTMFVAIQTTVIIYGVLTVGTGVLKLWLLRQIFYTAAEVTARRYGPIQEMLSNVTVEQVGDL